MRIVYVGSSGPLSALPLQGVLDAGYTVCAVVVDTRRLLPAGNAKLAVVVENRDSVESLAALHDIPLIVWSNSVAKSLAAIGPYQPDLVLVSCFPFRLPDVLLALPRFGCFNLHPSKLPAYRGPAPVFWQFRDGVTEFAVTLHRMSSRYDAGHIIAQADVLMPDGVDAYQADVLLGDAEAEILVPALDQIVQGTVDEVAQDEAVATYRGFPSRSDFRVSPGWPARRLYNFICATRNRGVVYPCEVDGRLYRLVKAESYQARDGSGLLVRGTVIVIPCSPGYVRAQLQPD